MLELLSSTGNIQPDVCFSSPESEKKVFFMKNDDCKSKRNTQKGAGRLFQRVGNIVLRLIGIKVALGIPFPFRWGIAPKT